MRSAPWRVAAVHAGPDTRPVTVNVGRSTTTAIAEVSMFPGFVGKPVTFTASVAVVAPGTGTPYGTVTFLDGASSLGTAQLKLVGTKLQASLTTYSLPIGKRMISATLPHLGAVRGPGASAR